MKKVIMPPYSVWHEPEEAPCAKQAVKIARKDRSAKAQSRAQHIADLPPGLGRHRLSSRPIVEGTHFLVRSSIGGTDANARLKYGWREWIGAGLLGSIPLAAHIVASLTAGHGWAGDRWVSDILLLGIITSGGTVAALLHWTKHRREPALKSNAAVFGAILLNAAALLGAATLYGLAAGRVIELGVREAFLALAVSEACSLGPVMRRQLQNGAIAMRARSGDWRRFCFGQRQRKFSTLDLNYLDDSEAGWG